MKPAMSIPAKKTTTNSGPHHAHATCTLRLVIDPPPSTPTCSPRARHGSRLLYAVYGQLVQTVGTGRVAASGHDTGDTAAAPRTYRGQPRREGHLRGH